MVSVGKIRSFAELDTFVQTGTVIGQQARTSTDTTVETTTHGHGGAYLGGPASRTTVSAASTHHQRLFARKDDGGEFDVEFPDVGFGIRDGQRVSVVCAGPRRTGRGHPMALINHSTGNHQLFPARVAWILGNHIKALALGVGVVLLAIIATTRGGDDSLLIPAALLGAALVGAETLRWLSLYRKVRLEVERVTAAALRDGDSGKGAARAG